MIGIASGLYTVLKACFKLQVNFKLQAYFKLQAHSKLQAFFKLRAHFHFCLKKFFISQFFPFEFSTVVLRWVLTAAHCLTPFSGYPSWIFVHVGIRSNGTYEMILKVHTSALHLHPNFAEYRPLYDIGGLFKSYSLSIPWLNQREALDVFFLQNNLIYAFFMSKNVFKA